MRKIFTIGLAAAAMHVCTDVSAQILPEQQRLEEMAAYNMTGGQIINDYIDVIADRELTELFYALDPEGSDVAFKQFEVPARAALSRLRLRAAEIGARLDALPEIPSDLRVGDNVMSAKEVRPFALRLKRLVSQTLSTWQAQIDALSVKDTVTYYRLLNEELDSTIILLEAENHLLGIERSAQPTTSPFHWQLAAMVSGNEVLIHVVDLLNGYDQSTSRADFVNYEAIQAALRRMEKNIEKAKAATASLCGVDVGPEAARHLKRLCESFGTSDEAEAALLTTLTGYGEIALSLAEQRFGEVEQQRLLQLERQLSDQVDRRVLLQTERVPIALAFTEAIR